MSNGPHDEFRPDMDMRDAVAPFNAMEHSGRRAMFLLIAALGFLLLLALLIFKVYQPGVRDRDAPPTISADKTPFKVKPTDPGGEVTPNQDKDVYKVMDGTARSTEVSTAPIAEVPITIPKSANIVVEGTEAPRIEAPKPVAPQAVTQSVPKPSAPVRSGGSDHVVQVASVRSRAAAQDIWNKLSGTFSRDLGDGLYADIKQVDLGDKGIYYRLRVAGLSDKDDAQRLCDRFKAGKQACFVTKK